MANIKAETRENIGGKADKVRAAGYTPAVIYGHGFDTVNIAVPAKEFRKVLDEAGENTVVNLELGKEIYPALIHDYKKDAISGVFLSVDFYRVRMDEKINAPIPIEFIGESPAVAGKIGILVKAVEEIEVEALPMDLPHELVVDISGLTDIDMSVYVKDIATKGKFEILVEPDMVLATVTGVKEEIEEVGPASIDDIVTEGEAKRAEEAKEEAEE